MTLESLVTDLTTSQKLRDAGLPLDTVFAWAIPRESWAEKVVPYVIPNFKREEVCLEYSFCSAWTAGELEEWLMVVFGFKQLLTSLNPDDPHPERRYMVLGSVHPEQIVQHAYGPTDIAAKAALVLEVAG